MPINEYDETLQDLGQSPEPLPKQPAQNPYDETVQQLDQAREQQLRKTLIDAHGQPAERAAEIEKLSQRTGIPSAIIDRNYDEIRKRAAFADTPYTDMLRDSPVLTDWLSQKPAHAAVAHDDLESLGFLEWLAKAPARAWSQGTAQVRYGMLRNQELYRELTPAEREQLAADKTAMEAGGQLGAGTSWFRGAITGAAQNLPNMIGAWVYGLQKGIPAAVAAGTGAAIVGQLGPQVALPEEIVTVPAAFSGGMAAGMYVGAGEFTARMESGLAYDEYLQFRDEFGQPLDRNVAKAAALATGYANGALEAIGLEFLFKSIPGLDKLTGVGSRALVKQALRQPGVRAALLAAVKSYGGTLTAEASVEVAQRAVTILSGELGKATGKKETPKGQLAPGNVNLYQQPTVQNADGSVSTVDSVSINVDGKEVLIPRVTPDGRHLTTEEAVAEYRKTGQNLGTFDTPESANTFAEQLHKDYAAGVYSQAGPMRTPSDVGRDLMNEGLGALQSFALTVAPGPIAELGLGVARARSAQANVRFFQALGEGVAQSKTGQRLPEALQAFVEQATKDGPVANVYADVDVWTKYWQDKGVDPAAIATEVTGSRDAYEHALNTGEQLEIPTGRYAVKLAATEHNGFWVNELRLGPDQMNGREAVAFEEQIAQLAQAEAQPGPAAQVKQQLVQQLVAAGYEPATAESYATLYESAFGAMAERAGLDPAAVFQQYGLNVTRGENAAPAERQVEPATPPLPGLVPTTDDAGQVVTPAPAAAAGEETPAGGTPAAQGESGASAAVAPGGPAGSGSSSAAQAEGAPAEPGKGASAATAPSPTLTLPATPNDVAAAVATALAGLQSPAEGATLAGDGPQGDAHEETGGDGTRAADLNPAGAAAAGRGDELPGGAAQRRSPGALGAEPAGRTQGGARKGRAVKLPAGYEPRFAALLDGARSLGYTGSDRSLAKLFTAQLEQARVYANDLNSLEDADDQAQPLDLLKMIAAAGGIGIEAEAGSKEYSKRRKGKVLGGGGATGELENMLESLARSGRSKKTGKAMPRQFMRSGGLPGVPGIIVRSGGFTADRMREHVQQDPRWQHLENLSDFLSAVDDAIRIETGTSARPGSATYTVANILDGLMNVRPDTTWWAPASEPEQLENNGSGESAASVEAINRDASMKARGERFVVYDRTGARRVLVGVDAVDYVARPGETYGVEGPTGFRVLDDLGGKAPAADATNLLHEDAILNGDMHGADAGDVTFDISEFDQGLFDELQDEPSDGIDRYTTGELQPRLPGAESVRDQEIAQPEIAELPFALSPPPVKGEKRKAAELPPSPAYLAAKDKADASSLALREATVKYRAREIGDDEYLAARHADDEAQAAFDVAFDRERAGGRSTTTLFQSEQLTDASLQTWAAELRERTGPDLVALDLRLNPNGNVQLETLAIARGATRAGLGAAVMRELTKFADARGFTLELSLAKKGYSPVEGSATTSSTDRLRKFYARFGFVSNRGRYKNFALSIYTSMYRDPSAKASKQGGLVTPPAPVKQTETAAFKEWFGDSKVVDASGEPIVVFHGTTHDFTEFDADRGNIESDFGRGIYFSNTPEDVSANYAGEGPDLTSRISQRAEQIASETDREYNDPEVIAEARAELVGQHAGAILPVFLRFENPAILGGDNETVLTYESEYAPLSDFQDVDIERLRESGMDDEEIRRELSDDNGYTEQKGTLLTFVEALRSVASRYDDGSVDGAIEEIEGRGYDGDLTLREAIDIVRKSEEFNYYTGDRGELVSNEIVRQTLERAGYDGVIDATVDEKFGSQRRIGKQMQGMHAETVHYIAFNADQVKSAIGNRGTFKRSSANILEQGSGGGRRGFIRFGPDRQFNINLLERADLSTFLHETGHFYLEVFSDLADQVRTLPEAERTATQQQLVKDHGDLLAWLGVEGRGAIDEAAHEKFARGFEAYLLEGNAPSVELRSAFARFRAWLVAIYKSLKSLRVDLTDDVRRVLDRMVATDKAIFAAEQEGRVAPMFTTADAAGMTDTQFGLYRAAVAEAARATREKLERRVMGEVAREQTAEWTRRRQELRNQVAIEVNERAVYQALAAMQHGTRPDGTPLLEETTVEPVKLSRARLVELFGADRLKRLPKPYIYKTEGGSDPEVVARMFGFTSADDMLTQIERAAPAKQVIEHETTQRMIAEHGSLLLDGTMHDKAREAVATEEREALIRAELRALANLRNIAAPFVKAGDERVKAEREERAYERRWMDAERKLEVALTKKEKQVEIDKLREEVKTLRGRARGGAAAIRAAMPPTGVLEEQARQRLATTRVRDLAPARYWSASRQAAQRALNTAARQDFSGAIAAKQQELINLHLYRQASDLRDAIEQRVKKIREQASTRGLQRLGLAGDGYLEQYQGILERYSFTPATQPALDRRTSLREWVNEREEAGLPVELPEDVLEEVRRVPYQQLTTEEFLGVADALDNIAHIAQLERRRLKAADDRTFFEARDAVVASIGANNVQRPTRLEFTAKDERSRTVSDWFASHSKLSFLARALDGYQDGGQLWDAIVRPLNAASDAEFVRADAAGKAYGAIVRTAYGHENLSAKLFIPAINDSLSHEARVAVALQWGNESGRERLTNDPIRKWTRDQVLAILDTLDKRDWDFAQATFDYLNTYWPDIAAKQERVTGLAPEKVEALPIETKYGQYAGGYYPLAYDGRMVPRAEQAKAASEAKLAATAAYVRTTTRRGHTEARKRTVRLPVRLDLSVAFEHLNQVIHDLTHHEALIDVTRMLRDGKVSAAIVEHAGDVVYQQFTKAVQDIALGYVPGRGILDRAATFMRTGTQLSLLGWNLWTSAQQPLGMFNGAAEVGTRWVARGLKRWLRDAASMENTLTWISEVSPFMRSRTANATQDLNDLRTRLHQPGGWFDRLVRTVTNDAIGKENVVNSYLWHIGVMQRVADVPTWLGTYEKTMALEGGDEARAIALADQAVRNAQGGGSMVDLAQVQRGSPIARAFMTFYSYGNVVFNQTKDAIGRTSFRSPAQVAGLLGNLGLIYFMPALATVTLGHLFGKMTGDEPEDWLEDVGLEMLSTALNTMVLVRELTGLTEKEIRGYAGPAGARTFELFYRATQQLEQGKLDEGLVKALNALAGTLLRYPAAQLQRTADGAAALEEGRTSNPFVLLFGAPPKNAKK